MLLTSFLRAPLDGFRHELSFPLTEDALSEYSLRYWSLSPRKVFTFSNLPESIDIDTTIDKHFLGKNFGAGIGWADVPRPTYYNIPISILQGYRERFVSLLGEACAGGFFGETAYHCQSFNSTACSPVAYILEVLYDIFRADRASYSNFHIGRMEAPSPTLNSLTANLHSAQYCQCLHCLKSYA